MNIQVDLNAWMHAHAADNESHSTSTATGTLLPYSFLVLRHSSHSDNRVFHIQVCSLAVYITGK